jgi:uncharacterized protein
LANRLRASGDLLCGVAKLDDAGQPAGSMEVVGFNSRADLDGWLPKEPFVTGQVRGGVEVAVRRVGAIFGFQ